MVAWVQAVYSGLLTYDTLGEGFWEEIRTFSSRGRRLAKEVVRTVYESYQQQERS